MEFESTFEALREPVYHMATGTPILVILTLFLLALYGIGSFFSLYTQFSWFDMVLHALGGAWLASIFAALGPLRYPSFFIGFPPFRYVLRIVFLVLIAGGLWEIYEYGFALWATARFGDLNFFQPTIDTLSDLALDAVGAAVVVLFLFREEREVA
ncbi:MAG: hypothetical protein V1885_00915 [Candidatus Brennerbacteria bacterium]